MLAYIMIAISIALIIGSWMWLAPSVRQKQLAQLRQKALESGFRVKFVKRESYLELTKPYSKQQNISDIQIIKYSYAHPDAAQFSAKKPDQKLLFLFNEDGSVLAFLVDGKENSLTQLSTYGVQASWLESIANHFHGILALEVSGPKGRRFLSIYWQEEAEPEQVSFTLEALQALKSV